MANSNIKEAVMQKENRPQDEAVERMCAQRMDKWYRQRGIDFERVTDQKRQFKGIDLVVHGNGRSINIDEKAKFRNIKNGERLEWLSLEIRRICKGIDRVGWFADEQSLTDVYCFLFPRERPMRALFFRKDEVVDFISQYKVFGQAMTVKQLDMRAQEMRQTGEIERHFMHYGKLKCSSYESQSINLVISRQNILQLPHTKEFIIA